MQMTVKQEAAMLDVDYLMASNLIRFLEKRGDVKVVGKRPSLSGKGKPSKLYELPESVTIDFRAPIRKAG